MAFESGGFGVQLVATCRIDLIPVRKILTKSALQFRLLAIPA
ncbi:Uncharacterised protein [Mycobacteroides abscessus subsp. abscessus]|nr:Uncharacterised protein [Mycobacteroides abscessus subsp. abscessus]